MKPWKHLKTILKHKRLVRQGCFKVGLYRQGIFHDMSKFSPVEFWVGAKYFQGNMSPNNAERKDKGLSYAWLHHKGRNKHHLEYWIDFALNEKDNSIVMAGMKMPVRYVVEMFMDRVAASKVYNGDKYNENIPLEYYEKGKAHQLIHPESEALLETMLKMLAEKGEEETFKYIKNEILGSPH